MPNTEGKKKPSELGLWPCKALFSWLREKGACNGNAGR